MTETNYAEPDQFAPTILATSGKRRWPLWLGGTLLALIAWNALITVPVARALSDEGRPPPRAAEPEEDESAASLTRERRPCGASRSPRLRAPPR